MLTDLRGSPPCVQCVWSFIVSGAKDQSSLLYRVPNIDIMQYVDANNEDTSQKLDHTLEVRDSHFRFDEAS